ncbi:branched-chain amino acid ABC transporter permease [Ottowia thiooxydans]|uniref:Branched-chain amino acid transport system permease protein n=1 Tax=Ottowia thiooxydans TaxID=219182 RepID=A0ABV2QAR4_9BURK
MRSGTFKQQYSELVTLTDNPAKWAWATVALLATLLLPIFANSYALNLGTTLAIAAIAVIGLNLLTGVAGQLSLGHAGFMAAGAYTQAILTTDYQWPALLALPVAGLLSAALSLIVGIPSLRLRGLYLALTTLGFSAIVTHVLVEWESVTRGPSGMPSAPLATLPFSADKNAYFTAVIILALAIVMSLNLARSRVGRAWFALHEHDIAARAMGINLTVYKLLAFVASAFLAGVAGALMASQTQYVNVDSFSILLSIELVAMLIVGGLGHVAGAVLGAAFIVLLPEMLRWTVGGPGSYLEVLFSTHAYEVKELLYGAVILLFLRFEPEGLSGIWRKLKRFAVHWPLSR